MSLGFQRPEIMNIREPYRNCSISEGWRWSALSAGWCMPRVGGREVFYWFFSSKPQGSDWSEFYRITAATDDRYFVVLFWGMWFIDCCRDVKTISANTTRSVGWIKLPTLPLRSYSPLNLNLLIAIRNQNVPWTLNFFADVETKSILKNKAQKYLTTSVVSSVWADRL